MLSGTPRSISGAEQRFLSTRDPSRSTAQDDIIRRGPREARPPNHMLGSRGLSWWVHHLIAPSPCHTLTPSSILTAMPSIDMPLDQLRQYKPSLYREEDFDSFWDGTI